MVIPSTDACGISPTGRALTPHRPPDPFLREWATRRMPASERRRAGKEGDGRPILGSGAGLTNRFLPEKKCLDNVSPSFYRRFPCDLPGGGGSRYPVRRGKGKIIRISRMWKADALLDVMPGRSREKPKAASPKGRQALPRRKNPANRGHLQFFVLDWQDPILIKFHTCILCIRYTLSGLRALRPRHRSPVRATFRRC